MFIDGIISLDKAENLMSLALRAIPMHEGFLYVSDRKDT